MERSFNPERREFVRVRLDVPVRYRFIPPHTPAPEFAADYDGTTSNISGGGFLLNGRIPKTEWIPDLLMQKIVVGVELSLPEELGTVRALTRVMWVETGKGAVANGAMGLRFADITSQDRDKIFQFVIRCQMAP